MPFAALTGYNQVIEQTAKNARKPPSLRPKPKAIRFRRLTIALAWRKSTDSSAYVTFEAVEAVDLVDFGHRVSRNLKARAFMLFSSWLGLEGAGDHTADLRVLQDPCHGSTAGSCRARRPPCAAARPCRGCSSVSRSLIWCRLPGGARAGRQRLALAVPCRSADPGASGENVVMPMPSLRQVPMISCSM